MDSAVAGACAGLAVDLSLYPIDTLKTRLQSKQGFVAAGSFHGVYRGVSVVTISSIPCGALFFSGYDWSKARLRKTRRECDMRLWELTAAAWVGETVACVVRVPSDMIKQRLQASGASPRKGILQTLKTITGEHGGSYQTLYRGLPVTLCRDLPFVAIQMCIYESLKSWLAETTGQSKHVSSGPILGLLCGAIAGGIAAFSTTPLDVARTRINLNQSSSANVARTLVEVADGGARALFRGAGTRVLWISAGGSVFFATYESVKNVIARNGVVNQ